MGVSLGLGQFFNGTIFSVSRFTEYSLSIVPKSGICGGQVHGTFLFGEVCTRGIEVLMLVVHSC